MEAPLKRKGGVIERSRWSRHSLGWEGDGSAADAPSVEDGMSAGAICSPAQTKDGLIYNTHDARSEVAKNSFLTRRALECLEDTVEIAALRLLYKLLQLAILLQTPLAGLKIFAPPGTTDVCNKKV